MKNENIFDGFEELLQDPSLSREQKVRLIQQTGDNYRNQVQKEYENYRNKQILAGALEIGSAAIPVGGVSAQIAKRAIPAVVKSTIGRRFIENTAASAIDGAISGAVFGAGEGLEKGTNPFTSALQSAESGFAWGGAIGGAINKFATMARAKETLGINQMRKEWGIPFRKASGDPEKAIQTLMENKQGFVPNVYNKPGIGKFDIPWGNSKYGLNHALERRATQKGLDIDEFINRIPDTIQEGIVTKGSKLHPNTQNIESLKHKISIAPNFKYGEYNRNWTTTIIPQNKSARKRLGDLTPSQNFSPENGSIPPSISGLPAKDNINDYLLKHKSPNRLENYTIYSANTAPHFNPKKSYENAQGDFEIWNSEQQNRPNNEVIKQTSPTTFEVSVEEQRGYQGYKNPVSNDTRIFSAEDIGDMTTDEFTKAEPEIHAQWGSIGIPSRNELKQHEQNGTLFFIDSYVRGDGSTVKPHYRARRKRF